MTPMRLAILGAGGRMGQALTRAVAATDGCEVAGGVEDARSTAVGKDIGDVAGIGPLGVTITDDPLPLFADVDGVLDFTAPQPTIAFAALAAQARIVHVIGTTGLSADDEAKLDAAARHAVIVRAGNMSLGVNLLVALARQVAAALDPDFDIEIVELHHRHKVDAPSGTALMLGQAAAEGRGVDLAQHSARGRDGQTGARRRGDIGFAVMRGGGVVGDHSIMFVSDGERIELTHRAGDRSIFATGAVKAALWGRDKKPGLYAMSDVLGISQT